ncbi:MAG TPA: hypothetical protein PKE16_14350 [Hyphomicrobium sp.]|nr:hypothetical protein [Hyphomicrobium sp.]
MSRLKISGIAAASLVLFALPISAYAVVENPAGAVSQTPPSVIVFNQKPKNGQITVTYAFMPAAGHFVVYGSDKSGKADKTVVGSAKLDAGPHNDFSVKLDKEQPAGAPLWASLTNPEKQSFWKHSLPLQNEFMIK